MMPTPDATIDAEPSYTERQVKDSDLHGLSKPALQAIVNAQKDKWPTSVHGKYTQKTNMATMRAALLDRELGFTIHVSESEQSNLPEGQDEEEVRGSPNENQTMATVSADQPVEGAAIEGTAIDSNEPDDRHAHSNNVMGVAGCEMASNPPQGPNYGLDGLDTVNPASHAPLDMGQGHLFNGSNDGQPLTFNFSGYKMPDFPDNSPNFTVPDGAGVPMDSQAHPFMSGNDNASFGDSPSTFTDSAKLGYPAMTMFDDTSQAPTGQQGCSAAVGVKPFRRTRGPACQPSFARAKNDPTQKALKQERTNQTVEWLMKELENRPGYTEFCKTLNHVKDNPGAVRSWTFAVDFMKTYNKVCLINGVYRKIHKVDIMRTLSVGTSWFFDAKKAVDIVEKYGEGGTHRAQPVIDKIASTAGAPEGSTKLLQWLRTWETEHPI